MAAAHALLFHTASSGLLHRVAEAALPQAVYGTFVAPSEPPPAPPPALLKTVALAQPPVPVVPPLPMVQLAPSEQAITLPQPVVAPVAEPAQPQAVAVAPAQSRRLGEQGKVVLRALFKSHLEDGRPVTAFVIVPLNFQLG